MNNNLLTFLANTTELVKWTKNLQISKPPYTMRQLNSIRQRVQKNLLNSPFWLCGRHRRKSKAIRGFTWRSKNKTCLTFEVSPSFITKVQELKIICKINTINLKTWQHKGEQGTLQSQAMIQILLLQEKTPPNKKLQLIQLSWGF